MDISRPSSLDIKAKACRDASPKLWTDASTVASCSDAERASIRWDKELPMRPMRAAAS